MVVVIIMGDDKQADDRPLDQDDDLNTYEADISEEFISSSNSNTDSQNAAAESNKATMNESIDDSIDKLESLIAENGIPSAHVADNDFEIPILTDVVDAAGISQYEDTASHSPSQSGETVDKQYQDSQTERLSQLVDSVDKKLSRELDSLVDLLKDTIKDSIIDELKEELKKNSDTSNCDTTDKPSDKSPE